MVLIGILVVTWGSSGMSFASEAPIGAEVPILLIGNEGNLTYNALTEMGLAPTLVAPAESTLQGVNVFEYGLIISGFDVNRDVLNSSAVRPRLLRAIEEGAVFLGFRDWHGRDEWLPVAIQRDAAYQVTHIADADHPILSEPNNLSLNNLQRVHGGYMYSPFVRLSDGWTPVVGGRQVLNWFVEQYHPPHYPDEMHYGIVELPYGKGLIVLVQMIPEYDWFNNHGGNKAAPGWPLLENIMAYVFDRVDPTIAQREPVSVPKQYVNSLHDVFDFEIRPPTSSMSLDQWDVTTVGKFSVRWDDRDVITVHHPHEASVAGALASIRRTFPLDADDGDQRALLSFYISDDYRGGIENIYQGDRRVGTVENMKVGHRFVEVQVDGRRVWEYDVFGPIPYEWADRFHIIDITEHIRGKDDVEIAFTVVDREGTPDPFWTDVFLGRVALHSVPGRIGPGDIRVDKQGRYLPVISLFDSPWEQSHLAVEHAGMTVLDLTMTADDFSDRWAVGDPFTVAAGGSVTVNFQSKDSSGDEQIREVYLLPAPCMRECARQAVFDPRTFFVTGHAINEITMQVEGPAGVDLPAPVVHGVPFPQGVLRQETVDVLKLFGCQRAAGGAPSQTFDFLAGRVIEMAPP